MLTDTDSYYVALVVDTLDNLVQPNLKHKSYWSFSFWFPSHVCDQHRSEFVEKHKDNAMICEPLVCLEWIGKVTA